MTIAAAQYHRSIPHGTSNRGLQFGGRTVHDDERKWSWVLVLIQRIGHGLALPLGSLLRMYMSAVLLLWLTEEKKGIGREHGEKGARTVQAVTGEGDAAYRQVAHGHNGVRGVAFR